MRAQILLFDMDGTLIDSSKAIATAWSSWAGRYGLDAEQVIEYGHGRKTVATMGHFRPEAANIEADADIFHAEFAAMSHRVTPIAGAPELLGQLKAGEWAVVTSAPHDLAQRNFAAAGLPQPQLIIAAEQVTRSKPDPEGYEMAARLLGASADRAIVFEDAEAGLKAGRAAGAQVVGVGQFRQHAALADRWATTLEGIKVERRDGLTLQFDR